MAAARDVPWWADYLREAMRSWGLAVVIVLCPLIVLSLLGYSKGGQWIDAKLEVEKSNASTNKAIAEVVKDLATGLQQTRDSVRENRVILDVHTELLSDAKQMMTGAPARGEKMIELLQELVVASKARQQQ